MQSALLYKPWYEHPIELICLCGVKLFAKRKRTPHTIETAFICETKGCGATVTYKQLPPVAIGDPTSGRYVD